MVNTATDADHPDLLVRAERQVVALGRLDSREKVAELDPQTIVGRS